MFKVWKTFDTPMCLRDLAIELRKLKATITSNDAALLEKFLADHVVDNRRCELVREQLNGHANTTFTRCRPVEALTCLLKSDIPDGERWYFPISTNPSDEVRLIHITASKVRSRMLISLHFGCEEIPLNPEGTAIIFQR